MRRYRIWLDGPVLASGERLFEPLKKEAYQEEGVRFMLSRELDANKGGILADDMGLGKTYELMGLIVANQVDRTLIVVPPVLLDQWRGCLVKYVSGSSDLHVFHGYGAKKVPTTRVVLTTYAMVKKLLKKLDIVWGRIIFDEAHHLRNSGTRNHQNARRLRSALKWGSTGTPIQNSLSDFHSLCNVLSLPADIDRRHEFMLRRTKASVGLVLPEVETTEVSVSWGEIEEFAREIHELAPLDVVGDVDTVIANLTSLNWNGLVKLLRARQVCVYPRLLEQSLEERVDADIYQIMPKMDALIRHVGVKNGNSKLVFCHFRAEIDILASRLRGKGLSVGVIDGRVPKGKRKTILSYGDNLGAELFDEIIEPHVNRGKSMDTDWIYKKVNEYLSIDVLILQIQTACEGLNLQQYQEVHFVSPHWNPAVEDQAVARCHRMGQTRAVKVYHYVMDSMAETVGSFDNYCKDVQNRKRALMRLID